MEISHVLGISRGPVREAVRRLSASGLLVPAPNLGSRVVVLNEVTVLQVYDVREALEALGARLAARHMAPEEARELLGMLDEHEATMDETSATTYPVGDADWDFHLRILAGARNDFVWRICGVELRDIVMLMRAQHGATARRGRRALLEHRWIAEAIADGNDDLAGTLMRQHVRASRDNLIGAMRARTQRSA